MSVKRPYRHVTGCVHRRRRHPAPEGLSQRAIETDFSGGGLITSNGGVTLLRRVDERLELIRRLAACFTDHRRPELVVHEVETLVLQRLYGLTLAYEELNDHEDLRWDLALQVVAGRTTPQRGTVLRWQARAPWTGWSWRRRDATTARPAREFRFAA